MAGLTHYGEDFVIKNILQATQLFVGLLKEEPTDNGDNIKEVIGTSYDRQQIEFEDPSNGETYNKNEINFGVAPEDWGWITHIGLFDSSNNLIAYSALDYKKEIRASDIYKIPKAFFIFKID